jgi:hypothetical protein
MPVGHSRNRGYFGQLTKCVIALSLLGQTCAQGSQPCNANRYWTGTACSNCPAGSTSVAGSISINSCQCAAGLYRSGTTCATCPTFSTSVLGSTSITQCTCLANYYGISGGVCAACPASSTSTAGSPALQDCKCAANLYRANNLCVGCPVRSTSAVGSVSVQQCQCQQNNWFDAFNQVCTVCGTNQVSQTINNNINYIDKCSLFVDCQKHC